MKFKLFAMVVGLALFSFNAAGQSSTAPAATPQRKPHRSLHRSPLPWFLLPNQTTSNPSTASSPHSTTSSPGLPASAIGIAFALCSCPAPLSPPQEKIRDGNIRVRPRTVEGYVMALALFRTAWLFRESHHQPRPDFWNVAQVFCSYESRGAAG